VLGRNATASEPHIAQVLIGRPQHGTDDEYERRLFLARKEVEREALARELRVYVPSMSHRTLVYKGLLVAHQLPLYYPDLRDPRYATALAVFHQRYSTNTMPSWELSQPFRMLAHNGEINTLAANKNWTAARRPELAAPDVWGDRIESLQPLIQRGGSDTAALDNVLETLTLSGRDVRHTLMMLVPEAWENMPNMSAARRAFYEYHACITEPWDGPASLTFSDGIVVGACLDRNGLRPSRYIVTDSGRVVAGSEVGMVEIDPASVVEKGRLGPGQMIAVDTQHKLLLTNDEIKDEFAHRRPYKQWIQRHLLPLDDHLQRRPLDAPPGTPLDLARLQVAFNYTQEELQFIVKPMAGEGKEPVGSMGDDTALAVLSSSPRLLYAYFKQKFAQVTNPPIDPIREELVMSLDTYLGWRRNLLGETEGHARLLHLKSPLMIDEEMEALRRIAEPAFHAVTIPTTFDADGGPEALEAALTEICAAAVRAVDQGATIVVLSDRGVDAHRAPVPMLLAVGAVHHHLIHEGRRMRCSIIAETAEARDVHQIACLIGFGASAVNPYLAFATLAELAEGGELKELNQAVAREAGVDLDKSGRPSDPAAAGALGRLVRARAFANYETAVDAGLLKIISKMGISTITGYHAAQIFEAIGLSQEVLDRCFTGLTSRVGGIGLRDIALETLGRHHRAYGNGVGANGRSPLPDGAFYRYRRDGEYHAFNPDVVKAMHKAVDTGEYTDYREYAALVHSRPPTTLRDLVRFKPLGPAVDVSEVELEENIMRRFATSAMSLGALSPEAHETMAIGVNRIGAKSNTGEGGEDPRRFTPLPNGDSSNSKIKQIASARFGVTTAYLASADEIEIKMAQGSKPGEGGQLPAFKVSATIAALRHTLPGTPLISPPPHHDIYSIEDLKQLIYDLKMVNPRARVAVKLVAEEGVGTIAAGVAKGYADTIHISGNDGGTGASPWSSIKNAGAPMELGLAEVQQVLVQNDLRGRVRVRADGGIKTGRDVVFAALMGAEEYGFGTAAAVAVGCKMARQCHLNTCPVGVATQREDLRAKFTGTPEHVVNFFGFVAAEVREILASLGARSLDEIVGRQDLLEQVRSGEDPRAHMLDLSAVLADPDPERRLPRRRLQERNDEGGTPLDDRILQDASIALGNGFPVQLAYALGNQDRTVGARLAGTIAHRYGDEGLPHGTIRIDLTGSAGQSFGAFCLKGMHLTLTGEANDYVAKGMSGGEVVVRPHEDARYKAHENVIIGNTCMYGATGGTLFVAGRAGERFAVRNSGGRAVVEGVGDHGCEYMTEGVVVILGETGRNFGAGMSNGVAYVFDERREFPKKVNEELVGLEQVTRAADIDLLRALVERHAHLTGSSRARSILARWEHYLPYFWKVAPHLALTEEGPQTVVYRHLESIRMVAARV
jgi:glutamate synthase domain-containing protein 2/glutamate synthase domain-containing protein 3